MLIVMACAPFANRVAAAERARRLEAIEFSGHWKTRETVLHRSAALETGAVLDAEVLGAARERLVARGFFHFVDLSSRPGAEQELSGMVGLFGLGARLAVSPRLQFHLGLNHGVINYRDPAVVLEMSMPAIAWTRPPASRAFRSSRAG